MVGSQPRLPPLSSSTLRSLEAFCHIGILQGHVPAPTPRSYPSWK